MLGDIEELRFKYDNVPLKHVRIGETVRDLFAVSLRHRIRMPKELSLLGKTLLTMEGVVSALNPSLSVIEIAEPFGRELFLEKWKPRKAWREWTEELPVYFDLLKDVPLGLHQAARS